MPDLRILIPTYKNPIRLRDCVRSLYRHAPGDYEVVISCQSVDSGFRRAIDLLIAEQKDCAISVLHWDCNDLGHVEKVTNQVFSSAKTPFVAWVHDDTLFVPSGRSFWEELISIAKDPRVGLVGPMSNGGMSLQDIRKSGVPDVVVAGNIHVPLVLCRKDWFVSLGGVFEAEWGVIDLCVRSQSNGFLNVVNRRVYIHHDMGGTFETFFKTREDYLSWLKMLSDNAMIQIVRRNGLKAYYDLFKTDMDETTAEWIWGELDVREIQRRRVDHSYVAYTPITTYGLEDYVPSA